MPHPGRLIPVEETQNPLYRRPQGWSGRVWKISPLMGFHLQTIRPVTSHYTDYTILAHTHIYIYIYRFQNIFLRCPTPRLHCFISSHWPSFRFLSFMAFLIPSIQFFFGLPHALFCFGILFSAVLGNLPSAIL